MYDSARGLKRITDPTVEPVTNDEALAHVRGTSDDVTLLDALIVAAREWAEETTGRSLTTQKWRLTMDDFPRFGSPDAFATTLVDRYPTFANLGATRYAIRLPRPPLQSVTLIRYIDPTGASQSIDPATGAVVDAMSLPPRLTPPYATAWPSTRPGPGAVTIEFLAGYGDAADTVPRSIRQAMLLVIGHLYRTRETHVAGSLAENPALQALLSKYRVETFD